jgi:hypothetical protein
MTPRDSLDAKPQATSHAVALDCLNNVLRARGLEPAPVRSDLRDGPLIPPYQGDHRQREVR